MAKKSNIDDIIDSKQAPGQTGTKKRYIVDHKVIWDGSAGPRDRKTGKPTGAVLVRAEGVFGSRRVIETSDKDIQDKLEKRGYSAEKDNKMMHTDGQVKPGSIKTAKQVEDANR